MFRTRFVFQAAAVLALVALAALAAPSLAADNPLDSLKQGTPELKSAGALAFAPAGILLIADPQGAAIYAVATGDNTDVGGPARPKIDNIDEKIASLLGVEAKQLLINSVAVNPVSSTAYLSVSRGKGPDAKPVIIRVTRDGKLSEFALKDVRFSKADLPNPPGAAAKRAETITGLAYVKGQVFVAGLSSEEFASNLRAIPFPFTASNRGAGVEIYHGSHGKVETASPIRTFVPFDINGEAHLLAAYTCTPLVKIPVAQLRPGERVKGTTIAELGNRNRPLDMIVYQRDGKDYILMANSSRGLMKITTEGIDKVAPITARVPDKAGLTYTTIANVTGVEHLTTFDKTHALILVRNQGALSLQPLELP